MFGKEAREPKVTWMNVPTPQILEQPTKRALGQLTA